MADDDDGLPWREGAKTGVAAWLIGFLVIAALTAIPLVASGTREPLGALQVALTFFLATHGWPLVLAVAAPISVFPVLFLPVPSMLLFAGGYRVIYISGKSRKHSTYRIGATVIAGYAPMTVLALAVLVPFARSFESAIAYVVIFAFTGIIIPAIAGGLGAVIAAR